jgi:hypothetical protein
LDLKQINEYLDKAIAQWRAKRDALFKEHELDVQTVYASGDFEALPPECLMAVCYVDAFNSVKASINQKVVS